jgi:hypothetical protein
MPTPVELAAQETWTLITMFPLLGTPTHPGVYDMEFENSETGATSKASIALLDQEPIHFADVCRFFVDKFNCPVQIDFGEKASIRYVRFDMPVGKPKKGKKGK